MKKRFLFFGAMLISLFLVSFIKLSPPNEIPLSTPIPLENLKMKSVNGKEVSLGTCKTEKGLLVIFSCNTCPYVKLSESRIKELTDFCIKQKVGCVIVNSNEGQRTEDDSFDEMVKYASSQKYSCNYVLDVNSTLADAFGASRTPQCFLFNHKGLVYKGAIDDNVKDPSLVKIHYLKDAIDAVIKNEIPSLQETKSIGCTIKRVE